MAGKFTDSWDVEDVFAGGGVLDGVDQSADHLRASDKAEAAGALAGKGNKFGEFIEGEQQVRPAVARTEDVPGAENGGVEASLADERFTAGAHGDVSLHHGRGVGDADVDEVANAGAAGSFDRDFSGSKVNTLKFGGLEGTGMGNTDEMDEGVAATDGVSVGAWL